MKQQILTLFVLTLIFVTMFYFGGYVLMVGLGVIGLTTIIFISFAMGAKVSRLLMTEGARLAIESTSRNDEHDAAKIKALSDLTREAMKAKNSAWQTNDTYPALSPFNTVDGTFTIAGLEDEEVDE